MLYFGESGPIVLPLDPTVVRSGNVTFDLIDDDALTLILTALPAQDASAAFCVNQRFSSRDQAAREQRLRLFWRALFKGDGCVGFPDVTCLTAVDALRFEIRLTNAQHYDGRWRCLSCLKPSPLRLGHFCTDCVGDETAFKQGNGGHVMSDVTCGHSELVYYCPMCEASCCRNCLMGGAWTFCILLTVDTPSCGPCEVVDAVGLD